MIYTVALKTGKTFLGQRGFREWFWESYGCRNYKVLNDGGLFPKGRLVIIPKENIDYIIEEPNSKKEVN